MRIKRRPEDFRVEELLRLPLRASGEYTVYRLEKRFWNTLDVLRDLERRHGLRRLSRAGLKDRYSESVQYLSLRGRGPDLVRAKNYSLRAVGYSEEPVTRAVLAANRFRIVLRDMCRIEAENIHGGVGTVAEHGVPNYYDEQRLGSARHGAGFIARKLVDGHYNGALRLFLATPSAADDARARRSRRALAALWGQWEQCLQYAPYEGRPAIVHLAKHPCDFEGAVRLIPKSLLELFLNAYQSWIWNETMVVLLAALKVPTRPVRYGLGRLEFYDFLAPATARYLDRIAIPAPGPRAVFASRRAEQAMTAVLAREGLTMSGLKLKLRIKGLFFKPYERTVILRPARLSASEPEPDELYPGRFCMVLGFDLPPGGYATIVLKRLSLISQ